ncbi:TetR/AcrR family transcriptional regulator [Devosia sp.]|uniref:TetR/AcrR family transcriptional regulator n=1 Tax=Devosia sp. TaxID=1871048 RepID=UPI003A903DED
MPDPQSATKRETTDDRRIAIAAAARALVHEKGFEGLRTRDIAERVGINIATLHYHVPTKAELISLLAETLQADFRQQVVKRPRSHLSGAEQLEAEFVDHYELLTEHTELLDVVAELSQRASRDPALAQLLAPLRRNWQTAIAAIFETGRADASLKPDLDPQAAALVLIGALTSFRLSDDPSAENYNRMCDEIRRAFRNPSHVSGH